MGDYFSWYFDHFMNDVLMVVNLSQVLKGGSSMLDTYLKFGQSGKQRSKGRDVLLPRMKGQLVGLGERLVCVIL